MPEKSIIIIGAGLAGLFAAGMVATTAGHFGTGLAATDIEFCRDAPANPESSLFDQDSAPGATGSSPELPGARSSHGAGSAPNGCWFTYPWSTSPGGQSGSLWG